ncbi:MAG: hypothetical protein WBW27_26875 [Pseudolabrys sp.]
MRTLIAALAIALLTTSAVAQSDPSLTGSHRSESYARDSQKDAQKMKAKHQNRTHDKKYKAVLESIPDSGETFDPWKNAR